MTLAPSLPSKPLLLSTSLNVERTPADPNLSRGCWEGRATAPPVWRRPVSPGSPPPSRREESQALPQARGCTPSGCRTCQDSGFPISWGECYFPSHPNAAVNQGLPEGPRDQQLHSVPARDLVTGSGPGSPLGSGTPGGALP